MATRIIEYAGIVERLPTVPAARKLVEQSAMTATGTSAKSSAFATATRVVCVQSDEAIYVAFDVDPTATANSYRIQAGGEQFFSVFGGWKVAIKT